MEEIKTNYLTWIKDVDALTHGRLDYYNIASSGIEEPTDVLIDLIKHSDPEDVKTRFNKPNPWGQPTLVTAIADRYGTGPDRVLVTSGVSVAVYLVCRTLVKKDDHIIVEKPVYEPLLAAPESQGAHVKVLIRRDQQGYAIEPDEVSKLVTEETSLIVLTNLHNPSGATLGEEALTRILCAAREKNEKIKILVDEVYHDFVQHEQRPAANLDDSFISVNSLSKVHGLGFLRCGWVLASPEIISDVRQAYVLVENIGSRLTETLASIVLEHIEDFDNHWRNIMSRNTRIAKDVMTPLLGEGLIEGTVLENSCIYFPKIKNMKDTREFVQELADKRKVFVVPGHFFGAPEHIRIGLGGNSQRLQTGLELLADEIRSRQQST